MPREGDLKLDNPRYLPVIHFATSALFLTPGHHIKNMDSIIFR